MNTHYNLSDEDFEIQFENASLNPQLFNHEAHLRLAWIYIKKYGVEKAIHRLTSQLKNYVTTLGAEEKYNHTLTIAAVRAVHHFILRTMADNFQEFIEKAPRLKTDFRELIRSHYATDIFTSVKAKREFLKPELIPFN
jgi:hypothetical protein